MVKQTERQEINRFQFIYIMNIIMFCLFNKVNVNEGADEKSNTP